METFSYKFSSGRVSLTLCWVCGVVPGYSPLLCCSGTRSLQYAVIW